MNHLYLMFPVALPVVLSVFLYLRFVQFGNLSDTASAACVLGFLVLYLCLTWSLLFISAVQ